MGTGMGHMGPGGGMGQGMMGDQSMGHGMMMRPLRDALTADTVRQRMEHRLAWQGNPNIKLGEVRIMDEDTILAEIVTQDGSLVQRYEINRQYGWMRPAQQ